MALSIRNICLHRATFKTLFIKHKNVYIPFQNCSRTLRGSRIGREIDKTEAKFQQMLKSIKESARKSTVNDLEESSVKTVSSTADHEAHPVTPGPVEETETSFEDVYRRLEEKVTPMKKFTYPRQLERKYKKTLNILRVFGGKLKELKVPVTLGPEKLPCPVEMMIPSPVIENYRNQDEFSVGTGFDGNPKTVGFFSENNSGEYVCVNPDNIVIIKQSHKEFLKDFQNYIRQSPLPGYSKDDGYWKSIGVRSNIAGDLMGIVIIHPQKLTKEQLEIEKGLLKDYFETIPKSYRLRSLFFQACPASRCTHEQVPFELVLGEPFITEEMGDFKFQLSPETYFQNNTLAAETMYESLRKACRINSSTTVIDVFCGPGSLSLKFAAHAKKCIGIDPSSLSILDARNNKTLNNQYKADFIRGNPEIVLEDILKEGYLEDPVVVINSSKSDLSRSAMKILRECKYLKKIVYITSRPKVAVDNFLMLTKPCGSESYLGKYFVPLLAIPFDLSPQTEHFGVAVMFQRL